MKPNIITTLIEPPIGYKGWDWQAVEDGYDEGDRVGYGATEQAAINDLLDQLDD